METSLKIQIILTSANHCFLKKYFLSHGLAQKGSHYWLVSKISFTKQIQKYFLRRPHLGSEKFRGNDGDFLVCTSKTKTLHKIRES